MNPQSLWLVGEAHADRPAVIDAAGRMRTFGELLGDTNRLTHQLRARGLQPGDAVASVLTNRYEALVLFAACHQAGWRLVPTNHHLTPPELAWIFEDSRARIVVTEDAFLDIVRAALGAAALGAGMPSVSADVPILLPADLAAPDHPSTTPSDRVAGATMTYTSGTTGRPKGIARALATASPEAVSTNQALFLSLFGVYPSSRGVHLVVAPLYHTAVLNFATNFLHLGHTVVLMDKWTPEGMLALVERHRVTSSHMVPTQFVRLLKLPPEVRRRYDVSSLTHAIHGAAPCPVEVKRGMIAWWGAAIVEYYAASEGGGTLVGARDWLAHPGTVGRPWPISRLEVRDDAGNVLPTGEVGTVWIQMGDHSFRYHNDEAKTRDAWRGAFFTVGDAGHLDAEGYLYLCDRKADLIISGGVNIYPAEVEAVLLAHPDVDDCAVFGVPDEDWGEGVRAVVQPRAGVDPAALPATLDAWCEGRLAKYKRPRSWRTTAELPRDPNGKLAKRKVKAAFGG